MNEHFIRKCGKPQYTQMLREFGMSTLAVVTASVVAQILHNSLPVANLSLVFLMPVLFSGVRYGLWPAFYAVFLGFFIYIFFFTEPRFAFDVYHFHDFTTLLFFLFIAFITGNMAVRLKNQIEALRTTAHRNAQMHDFSRKLASALTLKDILSEAVSSISADLNVRTIILLPELRTGKLEIASYSPSDSSTFSEANWKAAQSIWDKGNLMCSESNFLNTDWYFFPLRGPEGAVALLAMANHENANTERFFLSPAQKQMLYSYCDQAALAIERAQLSQDIEESRILSETEKLRSALLSSISHDLRTPLVSIIGSATSLQGLEHSLSPGAKGELLKNILDEAERLNRFIQNLLDMTRLGHGSLEPKRDWIEFRDILGRALKRLHKELAMHQVEIGAISELSTLYVDPVLMEQVLANILENASKYAPAGTKIKITFVKEGNNGVIRISDEGSGIPERDRDLVFDMFYRVKSTDMKAAGTGLGLAICRGLMEAHKGKIWAQTGISGQGTTIVISLPLSAVGGALSHIEESHE